MAEAVSHLLKRHPVPEGWSPPESYAYTAYFDGMAIKVVQLLSRHPRHGAVGGLAAALDELPAMRALFVLQQRIGVIEASSSARRAFLKRDLEGREAGTIPRAAVFPPDDPGKAWRHCRCNGAAAQVSLAAATRGAIHALVEKDRLLRSWLGAVTPRRFDTYALRPLNLRYEVEAYDLGECVVAGHAVTVAALVAFPRGRGLPLVFGTGAGATLALAEARAVSSCLERLGLLLGEDLDKSPGAPRPCSTWHQQLYANASSAPLLRQWLRGEHERFCAIDERLTATVDLVDLSPAAWGDGLHLLKAVSPELLPLTYGERSDGPWASLDPRLRAHPFA